MTAARRRSALREPYVWLLILFPALSVVGGVVLLALAIATFDGLVVDDYYRQGKMINQVLDRDRAAVTRALSADLTLDAAGGELRVQLDGDSGRPGNLSLLLIYATRTGLDRNVLLTRTGAGDYRATLAPLRAGRWHLQLHAADWRLTGSMWAPGAHRITLESGPGAGA